ncbi:MAG: hypothetical protein MUO55_06615 [Candidatus Atribacteria bacterium]|nr:hypothetical protein [Candidatus Atribacteria bacterium]
MAYFKCGRKALFYRGLNKFWSKGRTKKKVDKECDRGKDGFLGTNIVI